MGSSCCCGQKDENDQQNQFNTNQNKSPLKAEINANELQNISKTCCKRPLNESIDNTENNSSGVSSQPMSNQTQYQSASREEMAAAAERRAAEQKSRGSKGVVKLKSGNADLPEKPTSGLRWQVG